LRLRVNCPSTVPNSAAPRFSVTIPAYNAEATLAETIASVVSQSFCDWEIVIVDDGSTDSTREIAEDFAQRDGRIRVVHQENRGSGGAYNTGVRSARAGLVVMLSADDLLLPAHLASFDSAISEHPDASVFTSDGWYLYDDGRREPALQGAGWSDPGSCSLEELMSGCLYGVGAVYRREVFDAVGGFDEDMYAEDYLFWLKALARGFRHRRIARQLSVHRRNTDQKSAAAVRMREADARAVGMIIASGLLSDTQMSAARSALRHLRLVVGTRKLLASVLGSERTERMIARARGRHPWTGGGVIR